MADEQSYEPHLLDIQAAMQRLSDQERFVVHYAWELYRKTLEFTSRLQEREEHDTADAPSATPSNC